MGRLIAAIAVCGWLAGTAAADRIVVTSTDQSESGLSESDHRANAETIKGVLDAWVADESLASDRQIDVGVVRLTVDPGDDEVAVLAELRIAISDAHGQMVSVVSGSSKVAVSTRAYRARNLPALRTEALIAATQAMLPKLRAHLHAAPASSVQRWSLVQLLGEWFARLSPSPLR